MAARKKDSVEMKVPKIGIVRNMNFERECCAETALNQTDYCRILDVLRKYVAKDFPDDAAYNDALRIVCEKLRKKSHRLIMLQEVFVGVGKVKLDHQSGKIRSFDQE